MCKDSCLALSSAEQGEVSTSLPRGKSALKSALGLRASLGWGLVEGPRAEILSGGLSRHCPHLARPPRAAQVLVLAGWLSPAAGPLVRPLLQSSRHITFGPRPWWQSARTITRVLLWAVDVQRRLVLLCSVAWRCHVSALCLV